MAGNDIPAQWIAFDDVEVDVAGHRLFVRGTEVPLERKAFAVLVLLAGNSGRVFTRDEILDAVWEHRHITPGVLSRVITLLRQALGDTGEPHRYLHTVHGVGYRLDATVRPSADRAAADMADATTPATINGAGVVPHAASGTWKVWLGAAVLAMAVAAAALWLYHGKSPPGRSVEPVLVVLPLRAVGANQDEVILADGLSEELTTRLARLDGVRVISPTSAALASSAKLGLRELGARLHVSHALEGSLRQAGNRLRIDLRLVEVPSGRTLWANDYDRTVADMFAIESEIAQSVAAALALKFGLSANAPEPDPEGFREYLNLRWRVRHFKIGSGVERDKFIAKLTAFAARYPRYARAHGLLALALITKPFLAFLTPGAQVTEARNEAGRALELDPDDIDALNTITILACSERNWERCIDDAERLSELAPADALVRALYTYQLARLGYLERALEQAEIGVASDPLSYVANFQRARVLDTLGRHEQARKAFDAMAGLSDATPQRLAYARWFNDVWRHDFAAARKAANQMDPEQPFRESYLAATEALADPSRWPQVIPLIEASERASGRSNFLRALQPNADIPAAIAMFEDVFRNETSSYMLLLWNPEMAMLRREPEFQGFLKRNGILDYWNAHGLPPQCHREGDRAVCP